MLNKDFFKGAIGLEKDRNSSICETCNGAAEIPHALGISGRSKTHNYRPCPDCCGEPYDWVPYAIFMAIIAGIAILLITR